MFVSGKGIGLFQICYCSIQINLFEHDLFLTVVLFEILLTVDDFAVLFVSFRWCLVFQLFLIDYHSVGVIFDRFVVAP